MSEAEGHAKMAMKIGQKIGHGEGLDEPNARLRKGDALAKAVQAVLDGDYPSPPKNGQCKHGSWSCDGGCEACIDEFLETALAAYRSQT